MLSSSLGHSRHAEGEIFFNKERKRNSLPFFQFNVKNFPMISNQKKEKNERLENRDISIY